MNDDFDETSGPELKADEEALLKEMLTLTDVGQTRRTFLGQTIAGSLGWFALDLLAHEKALAALSPSPDAVFAAVPAMDELAYVLKIDPLELHLINYTIDHRYGRIMNPNLQQPPALSRPRQRGRPRGGDDVCRGGRHGGQPTRRQRHGRARDGRHPGGDRQRRLPRHGQTQQGTADYAGAVAVKAPP
jgi:hypothetical protein